MENEIVRPISKLSDHSANSDPDEIIAVEMAFVPQVEYVYIDAESARSLRVTTIVNNSDVAIRSAIYDRELEIIDQLPHHEIEFRLFDLHGRGLPAIMTDGARLAFKRK